MRATFRGNEGARSQLIDFLDQSLVHRGSYHNTMYKLLHPSFVA